MSSSLDKVLVLGSRGMVGSAVLRRLAAHGVDNAVGAGRVECNCLDRDAVLRCFQREKPTSVVVAAAKVGGIEANRSMPYSFLYQNLAIAANVVDAALEAGVPRLLYLGSSCIYPRMAPQPITEDALLTSALEPTNEGYAIAKISGLKLCQAARRQHGVLFHSLMPTNLYGPGDNYHPEHSHVLPALIRRFETARETAAESVTLWGTGSALREFLHVDDLADAVICALQAENPPDWANVGSGEEISIRDLAMLVRDACGATCRIDWDATRPDGTPRKFLDSAALRALGWTPKISLKEGVARTVQDYRNEGANRRGESREG